MNNPASSYQPLFESTRGKIVESIHFGAFAVVDSRGNLLHSAGDPHLVTFLRSSAKPFQALPFIEQDGAERFGLTLKEIALMCASHSGTDAHLQAVEAMQAKVGVQAHDLLCGMHDPIHQPTRDAMLLRGEANTPLRHNCSGKHTGMLAYARLRALPVATYLNLDHPVQQSILQTFAAMCAVPVEQVEVGIDGCSAPNFAIPLYNAAFGFARLCDPWALEPQRAAACRVITSAMTAHPEMVAGPDRFDTLLMQAAGGNILAKGGAEGYQALGILPGVLAPDSPGIGIAIKISDGDPTDRARSAVALSILRLLGALKDAECERLTAFGPVKPLYNYRKLQVGESRPIIT
ncbi:MAG: asparaginase [Anaerolineales bacterium]|nr:asparaginase [Anaerolineales bacterium]